VLSADQACAAGDLASMTSALPADLAVTQAEFAALPGTFDVGIADIVAQLANQDLTDLLQL
jgi:hypothetical protein